MPLGDIAVVGDSLCLEVGLDDVLPGFRIETFRLCTPDADGFGRCGRQAPHGLKGKTQFSIEQQHGRKRLEAQFEELERRYLAAPHNGFLDAGARILEGEAEIVIPVQDRFLGVTGAVHPAVCFTAMADAAALTVSSFVEDALVVAVKSEIQLTHATADGQLIARGRFLGTSGKDYLAESVLMDTEGQELGQGSGTFRESDVPQLPEPPPPGMRLSSAGQRPLLIGSVAVARRRCPIAWPPHRSHRYPLHHPGPWRRSARPAWCLPSCPRGLEMARLSVIQLRWTVP
jgi:acyl-coenzyme A thioesterase PaaI-like protein